MRRDDPIVCLSAVDWDGLWARPQQLMARFARDGRVLYIEPPVTLLSPLKNPALWARWGWWRQGPRAVAANLWVAAPPVLLPFGSRYRWINRINQWLLGIYLRRVVRRLDLRDPVLWTYLPNTADLPELPGQSLLCYDCVDEHSEFSGFSREMVLAMERDLLRRADVSFASARYLYETKREYARRMYLVPNAGEVEHYRAAAAGKLPRPADLSDIKGIIIGFIGGVHDWIDLATVRFLAETHPEWDVVMVGPAHTAVGSPLPNLHFLGMKPYAQLPAYLQYFAVGLIPFKISALTRNVNPVKLYEYLAAGKPVVASPLPELLPFGEMVYLAANREEFLGAVVQALREDSPERRQQRLEAAAKHSWEARYREMREVLVRSRGRESGRGAEGSEYGA